MALMDCAECGKRISTEAASCPGCGCRAVPKCPNCLTTSGVTAVTERIAGRVVPATGRGGGRRYGCSGCSRYFEQ